MSDATLFAIVLAAGASRRFGSTKQIAELDGETLVARAVHAATALCGARSVLVTGNDWQRVAESSAPLAGFLVVNPDFERGLSTSLASAIRVLPASATGALIMLADQPLVTLDHLVVLQATWRSNPDHIVASSWDDAVGPPVIFPRAAFGELANLRGDSGARALIESDRWPRVSVRCPAAAVDIDRPGELDALRNDLR